MEDKGLGIVLLVVAIFLLGFSFYVNVSGIFNSLADPLVGNGLGKLCDNENECIDFCHDSKGQCEIYCRKNPSNELCGKLFLNSGK